MSNQLSKVPENVFSSNLQLQSLSLNKNFLVSTRTFGVLYLDLSSNRLKQLKIDSGTHTLIIYDNLIESIECEAIDLMSVNHLYASKNFLTSLNCIQDMKALIDLDVSYNRIGRPSQNIFMNLTKVQHLKISHQLKFSKIPAKTFAAMRDISELEVDRLTNYQSLRQLFPHILKVSLTTTSWNCSYTNQVIKILTVQKIKMSYNDFDDRLICNIKQII